MDINASGRGNVVALEGPAHIVSTQLRLLPSSPDILTLPDIQYYLQNNGYSKFQDAPGFIRSVHEAAKSREGDALHFIEQAATKEKRLVFLSGGTASAYALCIATISQYVTDGDVHQAELKFKESIQDGLKGLPVAKARAAREDKEQSQLVARRSESQARPMEDPGSRAMRAAEALDRETAALQEDDTLDLGFKPRPRSMSLPLYGFSDDPADTTPYLILGAVPATTMSKEIPGDPVTTPTTTYAEVSTSRIQDREVNGPGSPPPTQRARSPTCSGEPDEPAVFKAKKGLAFRNAVLVDTSSDLRPSSIASPGLQRTRSLGRFHATYRTKVHDRRSVLELSCTPSVESAGLPSIFDASQLEGPSETINEKAIGSPLAPFGLGAPHKASVRRLPPRLRIPSPPAKKTIYVDKATDTVDPLESNQENEPTTRPESCSFQPVLPFIEDLVVQLRDNEDRSSLLVSAIQSLKDAQYPVLQASLKKPTPDAAEKPLAFPATPTSPQGPMFITPQPAHMDTPPWTRNEEYDPFAPQTYLENMQCRRPSDPRGTPYQGSSAINPPTPMSTPPPAKPEIGHKFLNIQVSSDQTALSIQNALRSVLESYFPVEGEVCSPFLFHILPKMARLWGPLFEKAGKGSERRNVDLILAIGSQEGVEKEYNSTISSQIEKMGSKSTGETRSGRVDIRYLIVNALQSAAARSLHKQARDHSALSASELAALLISQLDIYLRTHASVRFLLLEYPHDQLGTMLALRDFVGPDVMKIAGIIQSSDSPITNRTHRYSPPGSPLAPASCHPQSRTSAPFSKADFLLASSATDSEIANFMSAIWKTLMDTSPFYNPEPPPISPAAASTRRLRPRKDLSIRTSPPPLPSPTYSTMPTPRSVSAAARGRPRPTSIVFRSPSSPPQSPLPDTPSSHYRGRRRDSPAPSARSKGSTAADTVRTASGTVRSARAYRFFGGGEQQQPPPPRIDLASAWSEDSDSSDFDLEQERRLMPLFARTVAAAAGGTVRPPSRKTNSRKALKWLGLA
ncbi:uncharacterized protein E0L32_008800 [Thyridium curvatum]|uniref:Gastric mucin-like protein n=1 Tax=Thyridium curvatum TaxID=1093900 RepID=A0A507AQ95_9PEZI|nr:uncharacterized protein E0L32_008800 [Thyridium curvatum]TPX09953.1 hypothetical protein E0L32_008800 [Thyridium curvatum]